MRKYLIHGAVLLLSSVTTLWLKMFVITSRKVKIFKIQDATSGLARRGADQANELTQKQIKQAILILT